MERLLLLPGADVNSRDVDSLNSAAHLAALHGHLHVLRALLAVGADPNAPNEDSTTPLHCAAQGQGLTLPVKPAIFWCGGSSSSRSVVIV